MDAALFALSMTSPVGGDKEDSLAPQATPTSSGRNSMSGTRFVITAALLAVLFRAVTPVHAQTTKWVTGYYPFWWYAQMPPESIDFNSLTHIVIFNANPDTAHSPYLDVVTNPEDSANVEAGQETGQPSNYLQRTVALAHGKGVKVLLSVGGTYGTYAAELSIIANDSVSAQAFVSAACAYAQRKGLDGIEIDWEFPLRADRFAWNRLCRLFRSTLDAWVPRGLFFAAVAYAIDPTPNDGYFAYQRDSMMVFDQINAMTYTMWIGSGQSGFDTPVNLPSQFAGYAGDALTSRNGPLTYLKAGYPPSRLGISISFEATEFDSVSTMGQPYANSEIVYESDIPDSGRRWDSTAEAPWCVQGDTVYTFQDTNSVKAVCSWAVTNNFGGIMLYDLGAGFVASQPVPDALLKTAYKVVIGGITAVKAGGSRAQGRPVRTTLFQNYPNPFNPSTRITYQLSSAGKITLMVYDLLGRLLQILVDEVQGPGLHSIIWNAHHWSSGVYLLRLTAGSQRETRRMILAR